MLTAIPDQSLLDFEQRDVRRATDQAHEVGVMGFDAAGATIASAGFGRNFSRRLEPELNSKRRNGPCNALILLIWGSDFSKTWCHVCMLFRLVHG